MKRVVITGGTGFIGANLTRRILRDGHQVHLLVRKESNFWRIKDIQKEIQLHEVNFTNKAMLTNTVSKIRPDWIFHLAAYGVYSWQFDVDKMVQTNITGTINLVEASLPEGFEIFINAGTSSEYGFKDHAASEADRLDPNSYYAVTKASASLFCRYLAQSQSLPITTLRLYSVYGPYEDPRRLLPQLISYGFKKKLPPLAAPNLMHDFVYIEDVEEAFILAAKQKKQNHGAIYNVGSGAQLSLREIVDIVHEVMDISEEPKWGTMPARQWDTDVWLADNRKIRNELGWQPKYAFEQGFRQMANWFKNHPELFDYYQKNLLERSYDKKI